MNTRSEVCPGHASASPAAGDDTRRQATPADPLFSILIPVYNRERLIRESLDAIFHQTYNGYEIIVVDDGSTDGTLAALESYGDRIRVLTQSHEGPEQARNRAARVARGEYLAFLDSDDLFLPWTLATYQRLITQGDRPSLIVGRLRSFQGAAPSMLAQQQAQAIVARRYPDFLSKDVRVDASSSVIVVRRAVFENAGGLRRSSATTYNLDTFDSLLRFGSNPVCWVIQEPVTVAYREHDSMSSGNLDRMVAGVRRVMDAERQGLYPGGRRRRFARRAYVGGMAWSWVSNAWNLQRRRLASRLLLAGFPMVVAGVLRKAWIRLRGSSTPVRLALTDADADGTVGAAGTIIPPASSVG